MTYKFDCGKFKMQKGKVRSEHCNMKKRRLKKEIRDLLGALLFYAVLVGGVIILNARIEYLNQVIR